MRWSASPGFLSSGTIGGLAYSASSSFPGGVYFAYAFTAGFQSKSRSVAYATSIVIEEMERIAAEPVTPEELENAKKGFIDRLPRSFASKAQVAGVLAAEEFTGRYRTDPDYWQQVEGLHTWIRPCLGDGRRRAH